MHLVQIKARRIQRRKIDRDCAQHLKLEATMAKEPKQLDELFHDTLKDIYFAE
jgi:hypothetical protein